MTSFCTSSFAARRIVTTQLGRDGVASRPPASIERRPCRRQAHLLAVGPRQPLAGTSGRQQHPAGRDAAPRLRGCGRCWRRIANSYWMRARRPLQFRIRPAANARRLTRFSLLGGNPRWMSVGLTYGWGWVALGWFE